MCYDKSDGCAIVDFHEIDAIFIACRSNLAFSAFGDKFIDHLAQCVENAHLVKAFAGNGDEIVGWIWIYSVCID